MLTAATKTQLIDEKLDQLLLSQDESLFEAARYSLFSGGKRMRPLLTLATAEMLGGSLHTALTTACALELVHTYSMIHDDLPCMDDDDFRRGKPTLHRVVSEGLAVLTGDYLLTLAFEIIATDPLLTAQQQVNIITVLTKASGGHGMIGGQAMDLANEGCVGDLKTLEQMDRMKTGALISAAVECGALTANATSEQIRFLSSFSQAIGLAFQMVDDLLDVSDSPVQTSSDVSKKKLTYVSLLGVEQTRRMADDLLRTALNVLSTFEGDSSALAELAELMVHRKH